MQKHFTIDAEYDAPK